MKEKEILKKQVKPREKDKNLTEEEHEALHAGEHMSPCKYWMKPYRLTNEFVPKMRWGILQYVPIKVFTALATFFSLQNWKI